MLGLRLITGEGALSLPKSLLLPHRRQVHPTTDQGGLVFCNPLMKQIQQKALGIAEMDVPVLIQGEKGVGKASIARVIHQAFQTRQALC